ncbi:MAG TPA: DUF559 domain-containing protein, partial [Anaerolineales bacterium]|nr:DUF559 domain-containing protein [Anaerolineales bacterium]
RIRTSEEVQRRAKELRKEMTPAEHALWQRLRRKQLLGLKFRRQHPLGPIIADFCCPSCRLIVEIDGSIHDFQKGSDAERSEQFINYGYRVLRFRNDEILTDISRVIERIASACEA